MLERKELRQRGLVSRVPKQNGATPRPLNVLASRSYTETDSAHKPEASPLETAAFTLTGAELGVLTSHIVYGWFRGDQAMYVGMSSRGLYRVTEPGHHALDPAKILPTDTIYVWTCETRAQAEILEQELIVQWLPLFNTTYTLGEGGRPSTPKLPPARFRVPNNFRSELWARLRGRSVQTDTSGAAQ